MPSDYTPSELARASTIPSRWYLDPQLLDLERDRIFARTWQPVAFAKTVAEPGSFAAAEIAGEPVVVTRAKDGVLRAFSNVCRHRASVIADGCGKSATLRCPYHGWTYALDGRLLACPEFEGVLDWETSSVRLPEYRVETWGPYVFVNQDVSANSPCQNTRLRRQVNFQILATISRAGKASAAKSAKTDPLGGKSAHKAAGGQPERAQKRPAA